MKELTDIVLENPMAIMERDPDDSKKKKRKKPESGDSEPSTAEERFVDSALQTVKLHAKAKMLVNNMVTKIKENEMMKRSRKKSSQAEIDTFEEWGNF